MTQRGRSSWCSAERAVALCLAWLAAACSGGGGAALSRMPVDQKTSSVAIQNRPTARADGADAIQLSIVLRDAGANPIAGEPVAVECSGTRNTITPDAMLTDSFGHALVSIASLSAEKKSVTIHTGPGGARVALDLRPEIEFTPLAPDASRSSVTAVPDYGVLADGQASSAIEIVVRDTNDNPVPGLRVDVRASGAGNVWTPPPATTDARGIALARLASTRVETKLITVVCDPAGANLELLAHPSVTFIGHPRLVGPARYADQNRNGLCDRGDAVMLAFDQALDLNPLLLAGREASEFFELFVIGDSFGSGARVAAGASSHELVIALGDAPRLRTRGAFRPGTSATGLPSGLDLRAQLVAGAIRGAIGGLEAKRAGAVDLSPDLVSGAEVGTATTVVAVAGDLDRDGDVDLVVALEGGIVQARLNDGTGGFAAAGPILKPAQRATLLALADLDGDGWLDLVTVAPRGPAVVFLNSRGSFIEPVALLGTRVRALALGDVDGNGTQDLVLADGGLDALVVHLNRRDLGFAAAPVRIAGRASEALALGDVDRDGDLDLVAGDAVSGARVLRNDARGETWTEGPGFGASASALALFDLDRDGDADLVLGGSGRDQLWRNDGSGVFVANGELPGASRRAFAVVDLDRDDDLDLLAFGGGMDRVWLNDGAGSLGESSWRGSSGEVRALVVSDYDRDGDADLLVCAAARPAHVWHGSVAGTFGAAGVVETRGAFGGTPFVSQPTLACGDLDGDGDRDLVTAESGRAIRVLFNDRGAALRDGGQALGAGDYTLALALGDLDGDGDLDLVAGNTILHPTYVYLNDGHGRFVDSGQSIGTGFVIALALGDVDRDGDLDLVTGSSGAQSRPTRLWLNDGAGRFTDAGVALGEAPAPALALGDLDADGDLDLVIGHSGGTPSRAWFNDGRGAFYVSPAALGDGKAKALALGDLDRDGDLDLVMANDSSGPTRIWLNEGYGVLTDSGQSLAGSSTTGLRLGDLDGDGDLDLATVAIDGDIRYSLNDGHARFTAAPALQEGGRGDALVLVDLDLDGDLDVVRVGLGDSGRVLILR